MADDNIFGSDDEDDGVGSSNAPDPTLGAPHSTSRADVFGSDDDDGDEVVVASGGGGEGATNHLFGSDDENENDSEPSGRAHDDSGPGVSIQQIRSIIREIGSSTDTSEFTIKSWVALLSDKSGYDINGDPGESIILF